MATNREKFKQEIARVTGDDEDYTVKYPGIDDSEVREALVQFSRALDPGRSRPRLRKPRKDGSIVDVEASYSTAHVYLKNCRLIHERGFDLLGGDADEFNDYMLDMVDGVLDDYNGSVGRNTAGQYQTAARAFYRFCTEPGHSGERPDTDIEWPCEDIHIFSGDGEPRYDESDMFEDAEVDALREGCLKGQNPRRDRAFVEMLVGTSQRIEAIRTLMVSDVFPDPGEGPPYLLLNPEIKNDGDKGAIETAGRWRPIVSDIGPVREFIAHHPLRDSDVRERHGCPDQFDDCYLFVGDPGHPDTNASRPWDDNAIRKRLNRLGNTAGVDKPVKPHNFRHWAYSKSKELPIDESVRRTVFGWSPGSDTGDTTYGHVGAEQAGREYADAWAEAHGEDDGVSGIVEQISGESFAADLPPEFIKAVANELMSNDATRAELEAAVAAQLDES